MIKDLSYLCLILNKRPGHTGVQEIITDDLGKGMFCLGITLPRAFLSDKGKIKKGDPVRDRPKSLVTS